MTTRPVECVAEDSLGEILSLPDSDARRAHLESCPRCRALVVGYRQFLEPSREAAHGYGTQEETHLTAFRERLSGAVPAEPARVDERSGDPRVPGGPWWSRAFAPPLRVAWALVAVAVVFGGLWLGPRSRLRGTEPVLRGGTTVALAIGEAIALPDGGIRLSWQPHPEAEHYEVRFYSTALAEIGRRNAGREPRVTIGPADMPEVYRAGNVVVYRIAALTGADELEVSAPGSLQRP
ncbi:MAG: hypothetical protein ABIS67_05920 [Candidatus Eisenbacteria bacterium]